MPRLGELRMPDVREVYGHALAGMSAVDVLVLDADGGLPLAAHVELGDLRAGRGHHRALVCPSCGACKSLLLVRCGALKCRACHRHLTRRQMERHRADWVRRGAREEDQVLRLLQPVRRPTPARIGQARQLIASLVEADRARLRSLQEELAHLRACVEGSS